MPRSVWVSDDLPDRTPVNRSYRISTPTPFTQHHLSVFSIPPSHSLKKFFYHFQIHLSIKAQSANFYS